MIKKLSLIFSAVLVSVTSVMAAFDSLGAEVSEGSFTAAWLTDTQYYTEPAGDLGPFLKITDWIKRYHNEYNIGLVVHTGDITNRNSPDQWSRAGACMHVLDNVIPYYLAVGNHDMGTSGNGQTNVRNVEGFNSTFKLSDNPLNAQEICSVFEPGHLENAAYFYDYGKWHLLVLSLEFATRPAALEWAKKVVSEYPDRKVILITHDFVDYNSIETSPDGMPLRSDSSPTLGHTAAYPIAQTEPICSAEQIWEKMINTNANFILTLNGHFGSSKTVVYNGDKWEDPEYVCSHRVDKTANGNYVHQLMFNPQALKHGSGRGGHGWIRLLEFQPDGETIFVRTFSPYYAMDKDDKTTALMGGIDNSFSININSAEITELK